MLYLLLKRNRVFCWNKLHTQVFDTGFISYQEEPECLGLGVGGVNLGKVVWGEDGKNRTEQVEKKKFLSHICKPGGVVRIRIYHLSAS